MAWEISGGVCQLVGPDTRFLVCKKAVSEVDQDVSIDIKGGFWKDQVMLMFRANSIYFPHTYYLCGVYDDGNGNRCLRLSSVVAGTVEVLEDLDPSIGGDLGVDWTLRIMLNSGVFKAYINDIFIHEFSPVSAISTGYNIGLYGKALAGQTIKVTTFLGAKFVTPEWTLTVDSGTV